MSIVRGLYAQTGPKAISFWRQEWTENKLFQLYCHSAHSFSGSVATFNSWISSARLLTSTLSGEHSKIVVWKKFLAKNGKAQVQTRAVPIRKFRNLKTYLKKCQAIACSKPTLWPDTVLLSVFWLFGFCFALRFQNLKSFLFRDITIHLNVNSPVILLLRSSKTGRRHVTSPTATYLAEFWTVLLPFISSLIKHHPNESFTDFLKLNDAALRSSIKPWSPHGIRVSCAAFLKAQGAEDSTICAVGGWQSVQVGTYYATALLSDAL